MHKSCGPQGNNFYVDKINDLGISTDSKYTQVMWVQDNTHNLPGLGKFQKELR